MLGRDVRDYHVRHVPSSASSPRGALRSANRWWRDLAARDGYLSATRQLVLALWEFARDSTPERRRLRYGDAEYDWEQRVNTTSGALEWRDRLLGSFHSPYQPTDPTLFREMMEQLQDQAHIDFAEFTFVDLGSGKGRALMMASDYPFRRIVGVELLPALHEVARQNLNAYQSEGQRCFAVESICGDATEFVFPCEPLIIYLFNPLPETGLRRVLSRLERSFLERPRALYILYHNPLLGHVFDECAWLEKIGGTHQWSAYASCGGFRSGGTVPWQPKGRIKEC